jgi:hypothetical protein
LLRDTTDKQHLRELSLDDEKKKDSNGWEKLPEEVQTMVLRLSATSDEFLPPGPAESYLKAGESHWGSNCTKFGFVHERVSIGSSNDDGQCS